MCYTIEIYLTREQIETRFGARFTEDIVNYRQHKVSAFALPTLPVICSDNLAEVRLYHWGLIPFWARNREAADAIRKKTFNARAETLHEKASFRGPLQNSRCLIPVTGFYEWQARGKNKVPWFIQLADKQPFALAGLYDKWLDKDNGETMHTFTVVTTRANPLMEQIHNTQKRMPVILPREMEKIWLREGLDMVSLNELMQPIDESQMIAEELEKDLSPKKEDPEAPRQQTLF